MKLDCKIVKIRFLRKHVFVKLHNIYLKKIVSKTLIDLKKRVSKITQYNYT